MVVSGVCPFCGEFKERDMDITKEEFEDYQNGKPIIAAFPKLTSFDREFIITGMCDSCQSDFFNMPTPDNAEEFGEVLGECQICGLVIWSKKNAVKGKPGIYKCKACHCKHRLVNGALIEDE